LHYSSPPNEVAQNQLFIYNGTMEKIPPHDLDAEQSVLGSMMLSKDGIALVAGKLKPSYFYREANSNIFNAIVELYKHNEPVDLVTVSAQLKKMDKLEESGGRSYLAEIVDYVPTSANVEKYGEIVQEKALARALIDAGSNIISDSFDNTQEVDTVLENAQKSIMDISKERISDDFIKLDTVLKSVFDNIQSLNDGEDKILGVPSGFPDFDTITSGFQSSDLVILAARPAMGKTTLALNFATNAAVKHKIPVAIFSLEMPKEQLAMRLLASESKLDMSRLKTANLHEHEYKNLMLGMGNLSEAPIFIDDTPGISPLELRAKTRRLQGEADVKLIIIDYLQLMRSGKRRVESRFQEISEIVREVKGFAKESNIPIIALSQLSRAVEQRSADDRVPRLSDLRESGEIEQTADIVLFIHRDDYYERQDSNNPAQASKTELVIAKHRNGPTGTVSLSFQKDISKFRSFTEEYVPPQ
jgi:replicative DNA helicase